MKQEDPWRLNETTGPYLGQKAIDAESNHQGQSKEHYEARCPGDGRGCRRYSWLPRLIFFFLVEASIHFIRLIVVTGIVLCDTLHRVLRFRKRLQSFAVVYCNA